MSVTSDLNALDSHRRRSLQSPFQGGRRVVKLPYLSQRSIPTLKHLAHVAIYYYFSPDHVTFHLVRSPHGPV
jgi:hypothetical protein